MSKQRPIDHKKNDSAFWPDSTLYRKHLAPTPIRRLGAKWESLAGASKVQLSLICIFKHGIATFLGMKDDLSAFIATLDRMTALLGSIPEKLATISPRPGDWSVKEIACHLIDSASNNHQRFTRLQRTSRLEFPAYEPEPWVAVEKPSDMAFTDLFALFKAYNTFILHLVRTMDPACLSHVWIVDGSEKTLDFLMRDYYRHLDWHIHHLEQRLEDISRSHQAAPPACGSSMTIPTIP